MSEIRFYGDLSGEGPRTYEGEVTADGQLRLPPGACEGHFPSGHATGLRRGDTLWLVPAESDDPEALVLRKRTLAGERTVGIRDVYGDDFPVGPVDAVWSQAHNRLEVSESFG